MRTTITVTDCDAAVRGSPTVVTVRVERDVATPRSVAEAMLRQLRRSLDMPLTLDKRALL